MNIKELEIKVANLEDAARDGRKLLKILQERVGRNTSSELEKSNSADVPRRRKTGYGSAAFEGILDDIKSAAAGVRFMALHNAAARIGHYRDDWGISEEDALTGILEAVDTVTGDEWRERLKGIAEQGFIYGLKYPRTNLLDS